MTVDRYDIHEYKNSISTLPQTLKDADGIILATTVEWLGIGGYMQQFLDACWLYGDKEKLQNMYMQPVVMSTTYGEREAEITLANAWDILGGLPCNGICAYVEDLVSFEMNEEYSSIIEKKAENLYRTISQKVKGLPTSNQAVTRSVLRTQQMELTPQETEQLSKYVADDTYVKKQKEDIEELASMFKDMLGQSGQEDNRDYIIDLESHYVKKEDFDAVYQFRIEGKKQPLVVKIQDGELLCDYETQEEADLEEADVSARMTASVMENIIAGRSTFQGAFMTGDMTAKGNFKVLRMLDEIFIFE